MLEKRRKLYFAHIFLENSEAAAKTLILIKTNYVVHRLNLQEKGKWRLSSKKLKQCDKQVLKTVRFLGKIGTGDI